jgi:hypothetical protein
VRTQTVDDQECRNNVPSFLPFQEFKMNASIPFNANVSELPTRRGVPLLFDEHTPQDANASGVSWGAIFAGAAAAAALSLIMLILGTGLGLSSVSPWAQDGIRAATFGVSTILWITFTQLVASGMGGYLAGRLRTKWVAVHTDEVYFRDTAHGFLTWAVASLATAVLLTSVIGAIVRGGVSAGATVATALATTAGGAAAVTSANSANGANSTLASNAKSDGGAMGYFLDSLFRKDVNESTSAANSGAAPIAEVGGIFMNAVRTGALSAEDSKYVAQIVAQRTGIAQADAEKRVNDTFARVQSTITSAETTAKDAADKARKASAYAALWLFISLLCGAFIASFAATFGGRQRDA